MEKEKVFHLLETADWKDIIYRLTYYARQRARIYAWKSGRTDQLLGGKTPEDIACEAIEKVLSGTRDWDPDRYPNLLTHLQWVVKSDMEHLASSMEHQATGRMPEPGEEEEGYETIPDPSSQTPEELLIAREKEDLEDKLKGELYAMVKGDEDLEMLLLCFEEGMDKPEIIATQTGWDVTKVYNLKRKLLRKAAKLRVSPQYGG
jgi:hypothetical protein